MLHNIDPRALVRLTELHWEQEPGGERRPDTSKLCPGTVSGRLARKSIGPLPYSPQPEVENTV